MSRHHPEPPGNVLARQIRKDYQRAMRRDRRQVRRSRRRYEGGWIYRTFLWPDPFMSVMCYLLIALVALLGALLIYGQLTHGGDPLWWARNQYGR